ncbi:unnamed protein product [Owenia fusiformis]|uniref:Uncharacterized protein n=1 Tax=Owenia fusiformis TaxID=6347 RepID=A0A8J1ULQ4_OWEFU|nr:unnamed protein product [Owenia fusiformis]
MNSLYEDQDLAQSLGLSGDWLSSPVSGLDTISDDLTKVTKGSSLLPTDSLQLDQPVIDVPQELGPQWFETKVDILELLAESQAALDNADLGYASMDISLTEPIGLTEPIIELQDPNIESFDLLNKGLANENVGNLGLTPMMAATTNISGGSGLDLLNQLVDEAADRMSNCGSDSALDLQDLMSLDTVNNADVDYNVDKHIADSIGDYQPISPLSADEVESLLSSAPSSPSEAAFLLGPRSSTPIAPEPSVSRATPYNRAPVAPPQKMPVKPKTKTQDRKERKKQQNKDAATRYRIKKREEEKNKMSEEDQLVKRNKELHGQVDHISQEINAMKEILRAVFKSKGITLEKVIGKKRQK